MFPTEGVTIIRPDGLVITTELDDDAVLDQIKQFGLMPALEKVRQESSTTLIIPYWGGQVGYIFIEYRGSGEPPPRD